MFVSWRLPIVESAAEVDGRLEYVPVVVTIDGMRRSLGAFLVVMLAGGFGTRDANGAPGTTCSYADPTVFVTPGLSVSGSSGTVAGDPAHPAMIECDGPVLGIEPTGPGTFLVQGRYGTTDPDDCVRGGEGDGSWKVTFPTAEGNRSVILTFTYVYGGPPPEPGSGLVGARGTGEGFTWEAGVAPKKGDCVTSPVTEVSVKGVLRLS